LNLPAPSPVLDLRGSGALTVPRDLTTGCFVLRDGIPGVEACECRRGAPVVELFAHVNSARAGA